MSLFSQKPKQEVGENGVAISAGGDVIVGVTADQIRDIAKDMVRSELYYFQGIARDLAEARARQVVEELLNEMQARDPKWMNQAKEPDFQYALLSAQKAYARSGDIEMGGMLTKLLAARIEEEQRNLRQIVLTESLEIVGKITHQQIAILTVTFFIRYTQLQNPRSIDEVYAHYDRILQPCVSQLPLGSSSYGHLQYAGCGAVEMGEVTLGAAISSNYGGFFQSGVANDDDFVVGLSRGARLLLRPLNPNALAIATRNSQTLSERCKELQLSPEDTQRLHNIFAKSVDSSDVIEAKVKRARPYLLDLFEKWSSTPLKNFSLTSVGMAVAHANVRRLEPNFAPLSIWIDQ